MLIILLVTAIMGSLLIGHYAEKRHISCGDTVADTIANIASAAVMICAIATVVMLFVALFSYTASLDTVSTMENFYDRNYTVEKLAMEQYANAVEVKTSENTVTTVTIAKDFVDDVMTYNRKLTWYRNYQHNWIYSFFITEVPDRLQYLELPKLDTKGPAQVKGVEIK
jgi:hypothetical protein